jgi:trimethylamine--corrinoid protein Co-methyltransferase
MRTNYTFHRTPQFRVLADDQLRRIHLASLEILRRTGVEVLEAEARTLLQGGGARVDGTRVWIPPALVEWGLRAAPSQVTLCSREGQPAMRLEHGEFYYGTGSDTRFIIDPHSGERRLAFKRDVADTARLSDALPNIDFVMCMGIASDVSNAISDLHHFEAMVSHTRKPLVFTAWNLPNLRDIVSMAEVVAGGADVLRLRPFLALYAEPISPLRFAAESVEKLLYMAGKGLPVIFKPGMIGGATGPITYAGQLALCNAETLVGVLLTQLKRQGAPVIYGGGFAPMNMRTAVAPPSPELWMLLAARSELAQYYGLPNYSYAGNSAAKTCDEQAAIDSAMSILVSALSGANLIHDVGFLDSHLTSSYDLIVLCDEIIAMVKRMMQGIPLDDEALGLDVIDRVGPGGHYLVEDHTLRHFRENWYPRLMDYGDHDTWAAKGSKRLAQVVNDRTRELLATYQSAPLPAGVQAGLAEIMQNAEARVRATR